MVKNIEKKIERKEVLTEIIKYLFYFFLFYVMSKANINGVIYPFSFGVLFALMWCNSKVLVLAPLYILGNFLGTFDILSLYSSVVTVIIMLITYGIHYKFRNRMKYWQIGIYATLSQSCFVFLSVVNNQSLFAIALSVVLGVFFMAACIKIFEAITLKGFAYRLSVDEVICAGIVLIGLASGLSEFSLGGFELIKLFATFLILTISYSFNISSALFSAGIMGFGAMLNTNSPIFLTAFIIWAMAVSCFKTRNKYLTAIALLLIEAGLGWFFELYYLYDIFSYLPTILGTLIFLVIPHKFLDEISGFFMSSANGSAMRNIANRNSENLARKLGELSDIFGEMDTSFRGMIKGGISIDQAKEMLSNDIRDKICYDCPEKAKCHRQYAEETKKVFDNVIDASFERGKATLIDVPPYLTSRCNRINNIISTVNQMSDQYKKYAGLMNNFDSSRILVAEQMGGVSKIMKSLAQEVNQPITFDNWKENKIIEELSFLNIICSDAVVYEKDRVCTMATLVVKNEDSTNEKIEIVVSKICGGKMSLERESPSGRSGWTVLNFKPSPSYNIIFGTAATKKATSKASGDTYSLIKIDNDKFMMALCDGMGSGNKAEKTSNLAMDLVENFYKAGFDNDIILSSTNKLLALSGEEMFSALDIAVIDLRKGFADVIKSGAPIGLIKHKTSIDIIDGNSLPLGIINGIQPNIKKLVLTNGDYIILATDGITDSFYSNEDFANFVNNLNEANPQAMAEQILKKALANSGGSAVDDMTIIISKIFRN
ncbi:MAG: SpoIIE family protein phosphatase [Clostridia bacterium]|nr:SpoIIE family protein phosphatase [Clostridia bacterium]